MWKRFFSVISYCFKNIEKKVLVFDKIIFVKT